MKKITQTELLILELEKLKHENTEIKKLLKESVEKFVTKEFAERVYQWIGRPANKHQTMRDQRPSKGKK